MDLTDPTTAALLVAEALEQAGTRHALCGGLLLAAYGEPRETRDVDVAVATARAADAASALRALGVSTAAGFDGVVFGGLEVDRLTLLGGDEDLGLNTLDLVRPRSARYRSIALDRSMRAPLRDRELSVLTPEDFVLFKLLSSRDRDLADADSVLKRGGQRVDLRLIDREVEVLAGEITDHDIAGRWAGIRA